VTRLEVVSVLSALQSVVGAEHVLTDPSAMLPFTQDPTGRHPASPLAVVRPGTTAEVAEVLRTCSARSVEVVPQGGNTGLVGGTQAAADQVLLSLRRLRDLEPVRDARVVAGAGTTLQELQDHVRQGGLRLGMEIGSGASATLGGMVATNAGGLRVPRFGHMRRQVSGVEVVLADGSVLTDLGRPEKDNVGYDVPALMCGSEGTLGVITRVELQLHPLPLEPVVALLAFESATDACRAARRLQHDLDGFEAGELLLHDGLELVLAASGARPPMGSPYPAYLLVEVTGARSAERLDAALHEVAVSDAVVCTDAAGRRELWALRERLPEAIGRLGVTHKLDVAVRPELLPSLVESLLPLRDSLGQVLVFGHVADGSVHVNVVGPAADDERPTREVFERVLALGGSISAEHGIGRAKRSWLTRALSPEQLALQRSLKQALDPAGLLNPGALLPC
jgi:FAD/FMN-containing dehydrogenase